MQENYNNCLAFVLAREGGKSDDPIDRGGRTNMGITQHTYDVWRFNQGKVKQDVWVMRSEEAGKIYREYYWEPVWGDKLPSPIDLVVFDSAVQHSPREAIKFLQEAIPVAADGIMGPTTLQHTIRAAQSATDAVDLAMQVMAVRQSFYAHIIAVDHSQERYEGGWMNRLKLLTTAIGAKE